MSAPEPCPRCGAIEAGSIEAGAVGAGAVGIGAVGIGVPQRRGPLEALYEEVARIREIAERQETEQEAIAALTREVQMLRETVARLRGTTHPAAARPRRIPSPAA